MRPELLELAAKLAASGEGFALVTVVRREPPSSAHVGDTALVTRSGAVHGWVGGGCTRSTLLREALRALADGLPRLLSLSPDPAGERRPGLIALPMTCKSGGTVDLYVEPVLPSPRLAVFGSTPAARALARIGLAMGWQVDVFEPDADPAAFPAGVRVMQEPSSEAAPPGADAPGTYVLVAMMEERDADAIEAAVRLEPAYLGVIASKKRFAQLCESLVARGMPRRTLERITAPAGLDIGARTPEEIALSVMAQIIEQRSRSAARVASEVQQQATTTATIATAATTTTAAATTAAATAQFGEVKRHRTPTADAPHEETRATRAQPSEPALDEAIDPVCGMTVAVTGALHFADVDGRRIYFCCAGCRQKFLADPAHYAAASVPAHIHGV